MVRYIDQYDKQKLSFGVKEKSAIGIGIVVLISIYFMFFHVDRTPYGYAEIPEKLDNYLKSSLHYKDEYNSGKMVVIYYDERDKEYKYNGRFKDALNIAERSQKIDELYEFVEFQQLKNNILFDGKKGEEILKGEKLLKKTCRKFCVMNPKKKALYFYFEPQTRDAQYLESNLEKLEFWGMKLD